MPNQNFTQQFGPEKLPTGWPWRLFIISLILFAASVLIYAGLVFGYRPYLQNQLDKKDGEIARLAAAVPKEDQEQLSAFYSQILNLKNILDNHTIASRLLPFLEKNTNKKVFYSKLDADVKSRTLMLDGVAESFDVLAQQLEAFNQAPEVERYLIHNAQLSDRQAQFRASVILKPEIFR